MRSASRSGHICLAPARCRSTRPTCRIAAQASNFLKNREDLQTNPGHGPAIVRTAATIATNPPHLPEIGRNAIRITAGSADRGAQDARDRAVRGWRKGAAWPTRRTRARSPRSQGIGWSHLAASATTALIQRCDFLVLMALLLPSDGSGLAPVFQIYRQPMRQRFGKAAFFRWRQSGHAICEIVSKTMTIPQNLQSLFRNSAKILAHLGRTLPPTGTNQRRITEIRRP